MKRTLSILFALVLVLAMSAPALAAIDDYTLVTEDLLGQRAKQVNNGIQDAIQGKAFYADAGESFAVLAPSFMLEPDTLSAEDVVLLVDGPSQSMLMAFRIGEEEVQEGFETDIADFEGFANELRDFLNAELEDAIEGIVAVLDEVEVLEIDGMENAVRIRLTMGDDQLVMHCAIFFVEAGSGDYYLVMGVYLHLTDTEQQELVDVVSQLITY